MARILALLLANTLIAPPLAATPASVPSNGAAGEPARNTMRQRLLEGDTRLETRVTLRLKRSPLSEVVAELGRQTNVPMRAASDVADEPLFLFVTEQPAGDVMHHLATLLGYRWTRAGSEKPDGGRYEIYQDVRSKQNEEALRGKRHAGALAALQAALGERMRLAQHPPEQLLREAAALERQSEERSGSYRLRELADPSRRALLQAAALLTPAQWQEMVKGEPVHFSTLPEPGAVPLPPGLARVLRETPPSALPPGVRSGFATEEDEAGYRQEEERSREAWKRARGYCVSARLSLVSQEAGTEAILSITATAVMPAGEPGPALLPSLIVVGRGVAMPEAREPSESYRTDDPVLGQKRRLQPARAGKEPDPLIETLAAIAESHGINLIADAYRTEGRDLSLPPFGEEPSLYEALDRYVTPHAGWRREGAFFLARRHGWYHRRAGEIPDRVVAHWAAALRRAGEFTLEAVAELVASLRDEQLTRFEDRMREVGLLVDLRFDEEEARRQRAALRAYASLLPAQRRLLTGGGSLALSALPPPALRWLRSALTSGGHEAVSGREHEASLPGTLTLVMPSEEMLSEVRVRCRIGIDTVEEIRVPLPGVAPATMGRKG